MRPVLKRGLLPVWRDRDTLQIGIDSRRAVALTGMAGAAWVIGLLDGSRDRAQVVQTAADQGIPAETTERVLALLAAAGALDDFPAGASPAGHGAGRRVPGAPGRRRRCAHPRPQAHSAGPDPRRRDSRKRYRQPAHEFRHRPGHERGPATSRKTTINGKMAWNVTPRSHVARCRRVW